MTPLRRFTNYLHQLMSRVSLQRVFPPVTSPLLPPKPPRTERRQYSWRNSSKREVCMCIRILKPLEIRKEKKELTFKNQESTNCQKAKARHPGVTTYDGIKCDVIVASSISDDTLRDVEVNRLIARKRYVPRKRSFTFSVGNFEKPLRVFSRIVTFITLLFVMVRNVLGGLINIKRYERKSTVGNSSSLPLSGRSLLAVFVNWYSFIYVSYQPLFLV